MPIKTDYSNTQQIIPEGIYEVIIGKAGTKDGNGKQYFDIPLIVRNDVEQPNQNRYINDGIRALHSDKAIAFTVNNVSRAVRLPEGMEFDSLEQWGDLISGMTMRVTVRHNDYNGNTYANVTRWEPTHFPECKHITKDGKETGTKQANGFTELPEAANSDLPF